MRDEVKYILVGLLTAVVIGLTFHIGRMVGRGDPQEAQKPMVDTLFILDTIKAVEPKYITKRVVDSIPYPVTDTIRVRDTLYIFLERSQVAWEDSLARVYASGIDPHVDSVIHFTRQMVINNEIPVIQVKRTRWGIGVQGGYGIGKDGLTPWVGVGVSYNLVSW